MAILHCILGLIPALLVLEQSVCVLGKARPVEPINIRLTREVGAPAPIDCQLSGWGKWSECEPCAKQRYRSRSIVAFGQYGGRRCLSPLGDTQSCKPDKPCDIEPPVCPNSDFQCESGRCIKKRLVCNTDNDCGDFSDELCDDQEPKPTCRGGDIELSEIGRTAGNGLNILGMDTRSNPFDNEYFNGLCDRVRDGNTRLYYRKPWNVASLVYQTRADKSFTTETFEDSVQLISKMVEENTNTFGLSLSLKYTPTELNDTTITGGLGITSKKTERLETIKKYINAKNKIFMKVSGSVQLGTFNLRSRGAMLSSTFLEDVAFLPTTYDKGVYYEFLETYGTHYTLSGTVGGKYELVYVLDSHKIKTEEITTTDISNCLGFNLDLSVKAEGVDGKAKIENEKCKKVLDNTEQTGNKSGVIDNVVSFVDGGTTQFASTLGQKLERGERAIDLEIYVQWATSLAEAPVLIKQKPNAIYSLIPVDVKDAHTKKLNLERAIEDYLNEFSVCKCQPCQNGGTTLLLDGECICKCTLHFEGTACQNRKSDIYKPPSIAIDGQWGCWSVSSACIKEEQTLTRQCNNPAPAFGGKQCPGDSQKQVPC